MIVKIQPSVISGTITAAASKSSMQRALAAALLTNGETTILNPGHSNDDKAAIKIITALGADVVVLDCLQGAARSIVVSQALQSGCSPQ